MLKSKELEMRQSAIRERMMEVQNAETMTDELRAEARSLGDEYRDNETRYRAALVTEQAERDNAAEDMGERREWESVISGYEMRQAIRFLDEGRALDGATAEVTAELRNHGSYQGLPVPPQALMEQRAITVGSGVADQVDTRPIIDRLMPESVAGAMGGQMVMIGTGAVEYPVTTSAVTAAWAPSETGDVAEGDAYTTTERSLKPNQNLGVEMEITRRALKQLEGLEQAVVRDMRGAVSAALDKAVFQGSGASGEPLGLITGAATYGIGSTAINAIPTYGDFRSAVVSFIVGNAAGGPGDVRSLLRPEVWDVMDDTLFDSGSGITEWDRFKQNMGAVHLSGNALAAGTGTGAPTNGLLTTTAGGVSPFFLGIWGGIDLIRDPYTKAKSGSLVLTALVTADVTISRAGQLHVLTGLEDGSP